MTDPFWNEYPGPVTVPVGVRVKLLSVPGIDAKLCAAVGVGELGADELGAVVEPGCVLIFRAAEGLMEVLSEVRMLCGEPVLVVLVAGGAAALDVEVVAPVPVPLAEAAAIDSANASLKNAWSDLAIDPCSEKLKFPSSAYIMSSNS